MTTGRNRARFSTPAHAPPSANAAAVKKDSSTARVSNASRTSASNVDATASSRNAETDDDDDFSDEEEGAFFCFFLDPVLAAFACFAFASSEDATDVLGGRRASSPRQYIASRDRYPNRTPFAFSASSRVTSSFAASATAFPPADAHADAAHSAMATAPASRDDKDKDAFVSPFASVVSVFSCNRSSRICVWSHRPLVTR
mmetsp:Transcript_12490/g.53530  ORF Transcript_12490/g.53530 Transcript_12490/m.53530 type:complete len:200 (-) Transcript_12490:1597-2196(-)